MLTTLIIDDEPLAHTVLLHHLRQHEDIRVAGQCYSAAEALAWLAVNPVDFLLLDITMPTLNGMDMLAVMANRPQVIIVSAYQEYALKGFELDVCDYLLKPVSAERFATSINKVRLRLTQPESMSVHETDTIVVKVDREHRKLCVADIDYLEAYGNYVKIWQQGTSVLVSGTFKQVLSALPPSQFSQIHKSFAVRHDAVVAQQSDQVTLQHGECLKIGKSFKGQVKDMLRGE